MSVFLQVAAYDSTDYAVVCLDVFSNCRGFQKQQNSLGSIPIRVVLTADLMDNLVAESHVAKRPGLTRRPKKFRVISDDVLDFLGNSQMVRICLTVYQVRPIQVAA